MKSWFLAPDFTFTPDGPLQLGAVIPHPSRPTQTLASPRTDAITLPEVQTLIETNHFHSHDVTRTAGINLFAKFVELASASIGYDTSRRNALAYGTVDHEVRSLAAPFTKEFLHSIVDTDAVREHIDSAMFGKRTVYFISGLRVATSSFTVTIEKGVGHNTSLPGSGPAGPVPVEAGAGISGGRESSKTDSYETAPGMTLPVSEAKNNNRWSGKDISAIISSSAQTRMGIESCPLCEVKGDTDSPELIDHVLEHAHDFSLRSLPWPRHSEVDIGGEIGSFNPKSGEAVAITQWLDGYEHETEDIDPTLKLSICDYGRLAVITEQIRSKGKDKLGLDIGFADEHGDESAEAETDISQLTQPTTDSANESAEDDSLYRCLDCSTITEWGLGDPITQCVKCQSKRIEPFKPENDPDRKAHYATVLDSLEPRHSIPIARESTSGFRRFTDRLFSRKKPDNIEPQQHSSEASDNWVRFLDLEHRAVENQKAWKILIKYRNAYDAIKDTAKTLNRLFGLNRATNAQKHVDLKTTLSQSGQMYPPTEPIVTDGWALVEPCGFREACQAIKRYAFFSSDLPVIVNLEVHTHSGQQELMFKIMKEEWRDILIDKPLEGCDPRFRLPTLDDLRGRILITLERLTSTFAHPHGKTDNGLPGVSDHKALRVAIIQPLAELGVYMRRERFENLNTPRTKLPTHLFSMQEDKVQELISTSPTELFRHSQHYLFRVYPNSVRQDTSNLCPLRFWRYGVQMAGIARHNVDEGMMLNKAMFADEAGWVLKPSGYRSLNNDISADPEEAPRKDL
ncbi:1-phosphatidylinositol-45-bisphosphate phosphodiesterase 1 [Fusarium acutatum]|uniref:Phosphoinositide phospholipase C n=1 Tax=Fusarium acutatum TaxID=78861 RepID=A0A8H4JD16_9HYPO|nr:1-phosphatidylinositol-45-bisphosphate phosphodiesterase 1 [Fusarium acutatum]